MGRSEPGMVFEYRSHKPGFPYETKASSVGRQQGKAGLKATMFNYGPPLVGAVHRDRKCGDFCIHCQAIADLIQAGLIEARLEDGEVRLYPRAKAVQDAYRPTTVLRPSSTTHPSFANHPGDEP